jgi:hypothetical protein
VLDFASNGKRGKKVVVSWFSVKWRVVVPVNGPGIDNYDMALCKTTRITESASLEFRFETFNTFNHAQFDGAAFVDGNRDDATFGKSESLRRAAATGAAHEEHVPPGRTLFAA